MQVSFDYSDKARWNEFITTSSTGHMLQTWEYGEVRQAMGTDICRIAVHQDEHILAVMQMSIHPVPQVPYSIGYVPRGPLCNDASEEALRELLSGLKNFAKKQRLAFIKVEPNISVTDPAREMWEKLLQEYGVRSPNPRFMNATSLLDLTKNEDELLMRCRKNTRYAIRKSQSTAIAFSEDTSPHGLETFYTLLQETAQRQHFQLASRPKKYFEQLLAQFQGNAHIYLASVQNEPVASVLTIYAGQTAYYPYGASSTNAHGTTATEGLLWHSIMKAKDAGMRTYDLWGVLPKEDKNHPYWGYTFFKNGFGGELVEYLGSFDIPFSPLYYPLQWAEQLRRWRLRH